MAHCTCNSDPSITCIAHPFFKPDEIEILTYPPPPLGMSTGRISNGVTIKHKASGKSVDVDEHRHMRLNKHEALLELWLAVHAINTSP